jgi:hypothetical protein
VTALQGCLISGGFLFRATLPGDIFTTATRRVTQTLHGCARESLSNNCDTSSMSTGKTIQIILFLLVVGVVAFYFSPYSLGSLHDFRGTVLLRYWKMIDPEVTNEDLIIDLLESKDSVDQARAAFSAGLLPPVAATSNQLRSLLERPGVRPGVKDVAIWSLGELRVPQALPQLKLRVGDESYDQENLRNAIGKIEGTVQSGVFP